MSGESAYDSTLQGNLLVHVHVPACVWAAHEKHLFVVTLIAIGIAIRNSDQVLLR